MNTLDKPYELRIICRTHNIDTKTVKTSIITYNIDYFQSWYLSNILFVHFSFFFSFQSWKNILLNLKTLRCRWRESTVQHLKWLLKQLWVYANGNKIKSLASCRWSTANVVTVWQRRLPQWIFLLFSTSTVLLINDHSNFLRPADALLPT